MSKGDHRKGNKEVKKPKKDKSKISLAEPLGPMTKSQPLIGGKRIK
ncbi:MULTISPECIES: hypothetical protein [Rhodobacterales]|nr:MULTISPECIES: hypothetical protein [Rhodobacterales]MDR6263118.1 hypothetical protein [Roseobacter sp. N2S]